jgi:hypothetical protein
MTMPSIKIMLASLTIFAAAQASPASAADTASPILGLWKLDLASLPAEGRPGGVTAEFVSAGTDSWHTTYLITAKDGNVRRMTSRERLDGQAVPIEGDRIEADSVAMTTPSPGVLVMNLSKDGQPRSVRVYTVSADGSAMTENAALVGEDGKPVIRTFRWVR